MAHIDISEHKISHTDGSEYVLDIITPGTGFGAVIVPLARRRGVVYVGMVEQWREALGTRVLELPRGETKDLSEAEAIREVGEEMGIVPEHLRFVATLSPDTGLLTTKIGVWMAPYPYEVSEQEFGNPDENNLKVKWMSAAAAKAALLKQPVVCGLSIAAYTIVENSGIMTGGVGR